MKDSEVSKNLKSQQSSSTSQTQKLKNLRKRSRTKGIRSSAESEDNKLFQNLRSSLTVLPETLKEERDRIEQEILSRSSFFEDPSTECSESSTVFGALFSFSKEEILFFFVILLVYFSTMSPSISGGDSGELMTAAHLFGIAHPPGFPIWVILSHLFLYFCDLLSLIYPQLPFSISAFFPSIFLDFFTERLTFSTTVSWRLNFLSSIQGSLSCLYLYKTLFLLTKSKAISFLGAGFFGLDSNVWTYSTHSEVFSLNNLFTSIILLLISLFYIYFTNFEEKEQEMNEIELYIKKDNKQKDKKEIEEKIEEDENEECSKAYWRKNINNVLSIGAFISALAFSNQQTIIVYIIPIVGCIFYTLNGETFRELKQYSHSSSSLSIRSVFIKTASFFLLGLLPYFQLIFTNPKMYSWGNPSSFSGFKSHILREEYGTFRLYSSSSKTESVFERIISYFLAFFSEGSIVAIIGFPLGVYFGVNLILNRNKKRRCSSSNNNNNNNNSNNNNSNNNSRYIMRIMICFFICYIFYLVGFFYLNNLPISKDLLRGVWYRFFLQLHILSYLFLSLGLYYILKNIHSKNVKMLILGFCFLILLNKVYFNYEMHDQHQNLFVRNFGKQILDPLPNNSIVLLEGDLHANVPFYLQLCENQRPDLNLISLEEMSLEWFPEVQGKILRERGVKIPNQVYHPTIGYSIKEFIEMNIDLRPIFNCGGFKPGDPSWKNTYKIVAHGFCQRVIREDTPDRHKLLEQFDWNKFLEQPLPPISKYSPETWEYTLNKLYWESFGSYAAQSSILAIEENNPIKKKEILLISIELNLKISNEYNLPIFLPYPQHYYHKSMIGWLLGLPTTLTTSMKIDESSISHVYKNIGISCDHLRAMINIESNDYYYVRLLMKSWKKFLSLSPTDSSSEQIRNALQQFESFLKSRNVQIS